MCNIYACILYFIWIHLFIYIYSSPFSPLLQFLWLYWVCRIVPCHTDPPGRVNVHELSTLPEGLTCALCTEKQLLPFLVCPPWPSAFSLLTPNNFSKQPPGRECWVLAFVRAGWDAETQAWPHLWSSGQAGPIFGWIHFRLNFVWT